jgi:D-sedoheptulose 7-phosphate isomerase
MTATFSDRERGTHRHLAALVAALDDLAPRATELNQWAQRVARVLLEGGHLYAAGNGGSAAHAQHLTSELVGRYQRERPPLSAIALTADTSTVTALTNDYSFDDVFARQLRAHGRPGDVFVAFSTSGRSPNVVAAVQTARDIGMHTYAFTGRAPNPLHTISDDAIAVPATTTATVQEVHQVAIHILCELVDELVLDRARIGAAP